jgi:WD40 repeat protein
MLGRIEAVYRVKAHESAVDSIDIHKGKGRIATGSRDNLVKSFDLQTGREIASMIGHRDSVEAVAFLSDGDRVVSSSRDGTVRVWNAETGALLATYAYGLLLRLALPLPADRHFVAFDTDRQLHFLTLRNA